MSSNLYLLWILAIPWPLMPCLSCDSNQKLLECSEVYFEANDKPSILGQVDFQLANDSLLVTPVAPQWTTAFLKISLSNNASFESCSKLVKEASRVNYFCLNLNADMENGTVTLQYKVENLPDISSRKFLFSVPPGGETPLFLYLDVTDMSVLTLRGQKLPTVINVTSYKVEAYKEKNGNTNLQDFQVFSPNDDIYYELFTYNDVGSYYFVVTVYSDNCTDACQRIITAKVFIGRKSTRVVIGIVGASFILPFVLFIFHILTKKYPEEASDPDDKIIITYKSSTKKHNEVVLALAAFLEKLKDSRVEIIDLSKSTRKLCSDSLFVGSKIIYMAPPKHDVNPILVNKSLSEKKFYGVTFDYCEKLPLFISSNKTFKLFDDFNKLLNVLELPESYDEALYNDLVKRSEEATQEANRLLKSDLPKIVVTEIEPQEHDSLISAKVVL